MPREYQRQQAFDYSRTHSRRGDRSDYVGCRLGTELRARAIQAAEQAGIPLSEWLRMVVASALDNGVVSGLGDPTNEGYLHGRRMGLAIAQQQVIEALRAAQENVPMSLEEATARGMVVPDGYPNSY